jgi:hypothetical protein
MNNNGSGFIFSMAKEFLRKGGKITFLSLEFDKERAKERILRIIKDQKKNQR